MELTEQIEALEKKPKLTLQERVMLKMLKEKASENPPGDTAPQQNGMFTINPGREELVYINPKDIKPNPYQPRKHFKPGEIEELADSLRTIEIIQPISVAKYNDEFILIAGQKRLECYKRLNQQEVEDGLEPLEMKFLLMPCFIKHVKEIEEISSLALAENSARKNPYVMDSALAIKENFEIFKAKDPKLNQSRYAEFAKENFGIEAKSTISKYLKIATLEPEVQAEVFRLGYNSFNGLYEIAGSNLSIEEKIKRLTDEKTPALLNPEDADEEPEQAEESDSSGTGEESAAKKKEQTEGTPGQGTTSLKPKSKIDLDYLINTIENLAATLDEDKERLKDELVEYLSEFQ